MGEPQAQLAALGIRSQIAVPLMREGQFCALLSVNQTTPRVWTDEEVALAEEVAGRTWAEVERARAEAALRESEAKLGVELADMQQLQRISSSLIKDDDDDALCRQILDAARAVMRSDMASLQRLSPERHELFLLAQHGFAPNSAKFWEWVQPDDTTSCGVALAHGKPVIVPDVEQWDFIAGTEVLAHYRLSGIRALLSTPLIARDGHLVGVMSTHWREAHEPSERELRLFDVLARQAADFIERRTAEAALQALNDPLEERVAQRTASLRESEEPFRALVEASAQIVWTTDAEGRVVEDFPFLARLHRPDAGGVARRGLAGRGASRGPGGRGPAVAGSHRARDAGGHPVPPAARRERRMAHDAGARRATAERGRDGPRLGGHQHRPHPSGAGRQRRGPAAT